MLCKECLHHSAIDTTAIRAGSKPEKRLSKCVTSGTATEQGDLTMASYLAVAILAVLVTLSSASSLRQKRQVVDFQCGADGVYGNPQNCSTFYQCYSGLAYLSNCPTGLEFNIDKDACDFPNLIIQGACQRSSTASNINAPCLRRNIITDVYLAPNSRYCNAFFNCNNGVINPQCLFCGVGEIFNSDSGSCEHVSYLDSADVIERCGSSRVIVPSANQSVESLSDDCRLGDNPFRELYSKIKNGEQDLFNEA